MNSVEQIILTSLIDLAHSRCSLDLLDGEIRVLKDSARRIDSEYDEPSKEERSLKEIRPGFLRWLIVDLEAAKLMNPDGVIIVEGHFSSALDLEHCVAQLPIVFNHCVFVDGLSFSFAALKSLDLGHSAIHGPMQLLTTRVEGNLSIVECECAAPIILTGARIGGMVVLNGTKSKSQSMSLDMHAAVLSGPMFMNVGFEADGQISMYGASVGGSLNARGAQFRALGISFAANRIRVKGDLILSDAFFGHACHINGGVVEGSAVFSGTQIGTDGVGEELQLSGSRVEGNLSLDQLYIRGALYLVRFHVCGNLNCIAANVGAFHGALLTAEQDLIWRGVTLYSGGWLVLDHAKIATFRDDESSWPLPGCLRLQGARIDRVIQHELMSAAEKEGGKWTNEKPSSADVRIDWLNRQDNLNALDAHSWYQVADMFADRGDSTGSRKIVHQYRRHEARSQFRLNQPSRYAFVRPDRRYKPSLLINQGGNYHIRMGGRWLQWWKKLTLAMFEREPMLVLVPILFCALMATSVFYPLRAHFSPTGIEAYKAAYGPRDEKAIVGSYPEFSPFVYSLENVLPVIRLGQDEKWAPNPRLKPKWVYQLLMTVRWLLILAGWGQATVLATVLGQRFVSSRK